MTTGIISYGAYVPVSRLSMADIAQALGSMVGSRTRAVAGYDEDTTSMAVEAGREALANLGGRATPHALFFSTTQPAYTDKSNSSVIHAALGLDSAAFAVDMVGAVRSSVGAVRSALQSPGCAIAVVSDMRTGLPGSADERQGGDAAIALMTGDGSDAPVIAEFLGAWSATAEFLDRWRAPGETAAHTWEERFAEPIYARLADEAFADACKGADISPDSVDHVIVAGLHDRAVRRVGGAMAARDKPRDTLSSRIGNSAAAHPWLQLAAKLDTASPGDTIAVLVLADGADVLLFRATDAIADFRPRFPVEDLVAQGSPTMPYAQFLTWRGFLKREPPRRPDPEAAAAPPALRASAWKHGFAAARCTACGMRHLPPQRVCARCHAVDQMTSERLAEVKATIATMTVDHLAFSPSSPVVAAVIDFDGGGRLSCELTDVDPAAVAEGDRVGMTFRRVSTARGIHNYFWKARPVRTGAQA